MREAGTHLVGGIALGRGGESLDGLALYDDVRQLPEAADAAVIYTPPEGVLDAVRAAAGIPTIVVAAEYVPVHDTLRAAQAARAAGSWLVGPNTLGLCVPEEGLLGFDCISPLKPFLGAGFADLKARLQAAVALRYALPPWNAESKRDHKLCDIALAAAEAVHVAGWTREEVRSTLGIRAAVMTADPLAGFGEEAWRPWPPELAAERFLVALRAATGEG